MTPTTTREAPVYPTWIRGRRIVACWALAGLIVLVAAVLGRLWTLAFGIALLALPFIYVALLITLTSYRLSSRGDAVQGQIHQLLIDSVGTGGRLLDVGCGSGELLIRFARQGGCDAELVGIDHWGEDWEYSQVQAESNARAEGVPGLRFVRGTASSLPFATSEFARVVSALTFHEVRDVEDKTVSVGEAVRVLQPGGRFAFVDLFDDVRIYGGRGRAEEAVRQAGGVLETSRRVSDLVDLRWPLTLRQGLKYGVILTGTKSAGT